MVKDDRQHLNELRELHVRSLHQLERQAAEFGLQTPSHITLQIEDTKKAIADIDENLNIDIPPICELPPDITSFTGRRKQLKEIQLFFKQAAQGKGNAMRISSITGMAGVGKSTLAIHAAHSLKEYFPDLQLYVNLRDESVKIVKSLDAFDVLASFLRVLGIKEQNLPKDMAGRSKLYRWHMAKKRCLVLLDNAEDDEQTISLLPDSSTCAVIVTSRRPFSVGRDERIIDLEVMTEIEALNLLKRLIGEKRVNSELKQAKKILRKCNSLPLAIRIIGGTLKIKYDEKLENYASKLDDPRSLKIYQLSNLNVSSNIDLSYQSLDSNSARLFRALGCLTGADFHEKVCSSMLDVPSEEIEQQIKHLVDVHLLEPASSGRYRFHELVRLFAQERLEEDEIKKGQWDIHKRMIEFFISYVENNEENYSALDLETGNIYGALELAYKLEIHEAIVRGANAMRLFFDTRGLYEKAKLYLERAEQAAEAQNDSLGLAKTKRNLGLLRAAHHEYDEAEKFFMDGLILARASGDTKMISALLQSLGKVKSDRGHYTEAETYFHEALPMARKNEDNRRVLGLLADLGVTEYTHGNYAESEKYYRDGLELSPKIANKRQIIDLHIGLGWTTAHRYGNYSQADKHWKKGLELAQSIEYYYMVNFIISNLGWSADRRGEYISAERLLNESLAFSQSHDYRSVASATYINLGVMALHRGNYVQSEEYLRESLNLCREIQVSQHTGVVLENLGILACRRGNYDLSEYYLQEALDKVYKGYRERVCALKTYLGEIMILRMQYEQAELYLNAALDLSREMNHSERTSIVLERFGELLIHQGKFTQAQRYLQESLTIANNIGYRWLICSILNTCGEVHLGREQFNLASEVYEQSLKGAHDIGSRDQIAIAQYGLARVKYAQGSVGEASRLARESLATFEFIGHRKTVDVSRWLTPLMRTTTS